MNDFATYIRARLDELGMTQTELAEAAGLPRQRVNDFACGRRTPRLDQMREICAVLGEYTIKKETHDE